MVTHHEVAQDTVETGLMRFVGVLAVVMPSLALLQVLANSREYRQPAVAVAVWLGVLGVARWLVPRLRRGGLGAGETAAAIAVAVVAVAVVGAARRPHDHPGSVDLAVLGTIWLLALVVLSRSTRVWIPAALLVFAMQGALLIHDGGVNQVSLSQLTVVGYIMATILLAFAALRPTIDMHVRIAARRASLASRSVAERAAAAAIARERHEQARDPRAGRAPTAARYRQRDAGPRHRHGARAVRPARGGPAGLPQPFTRRRFSRSR